MKTQYTVALAMFAGFGLGAVAVQALHAQAKPPVYQITEITPANVETYVKDYVPRAQAAIKAAGGRLIAGGAATAVDGDAPKPRVAITAWDSAQRNSKPTAIQPPFENSADPRPSWRSSASSHRLRAYRTSRRPTGYEAAFDWRPRPKLGAVVHVRDAEATGCDYSEPLGAKQRHPPRPQTALAPVYGAWAGLAPR